MDGTCCNDSSLYAYLKSEGLIIFTIQVDLLNPDVFTSLSEIEILTNRTVLKKCFGRDAHMQKIKNMLEL